MKYARRFDQLADPSIAKSEHKDDWSNAHKRASSPVPSIQDSLKSRNLLPAEKPSTLESNRTKAALISITLNIATQTATLAKARTPARREKKEQPTCMKQNPSPAKRPKPTEMEVPSRSPHKHTTDKKKQRHKTHRKRTHKPRKNPKDRTESNNRSSAFADSRQPYRRLIGTIRFTTPPRSVGTVIKVLRWLRRKSASLQSARLAARPNEAKTEPPTENRQHLSFHDPMRVRSPRLTVISLLEGDPRGSFITIGVGRKRGRGVPRVEECAAKLQMSLQEASSQKIWYLKCEGGTANCRVNTRTHTLKILADANTNVKDVSTDNRPMDGMPARGKRIQSGPHIQREIRSIVQNNMISKCDWSKSLTAPPPGPQNAPIYPRHPCRQPMPIGEEKKWEK
ncbi:hypothetical protein B0J17DRAFT_626377 [Rhizoctonia solani]|nr:hypothetical protein B0J17DRAFT_626377 [Rhizoctonia solani]